RLVIQTRAWTWLPQYRTGETAPTQPASGPSGCAPGRLLYGSSVALWAVVATAFSCLCVLWHSDLYFFSPSTRRACTELCAGHYGSDCRHRFRADIFLCTRESRDIRDEPLQDPVIPRRGRRA